LTARAGEIDVGSPRRADVNALNFLEGRFGLIGGRCRGGINLSFVRVGDDPSKAGGATSEVCAFYGRVVAFRPVIALLRRSSALYGECMARSISTTVRLGEEDIRALKRARAAGLSASDLIRKGLRVVASRYYSGRRPPSTLLFESTSSKLGDESELFRDLDG